MGCANVLKKASRLAMSSALEAIITVPLFAKGLVGVYHFFGTKIASDLPVSDRNGPLWRVVTVRQVHGTEALVLDQRSARGPKSSTDAHGDDAIVNDQPGVLVTAHTPDALPAPCLDP